MFACLIYCLDASLEFLFADKLTNDILIMLALNSNNVHFLPNLGMNLLNQDGLLWSLQSIYESIKFHFNNIVLWVMNYKKIRILCNVILSPRVPTCPKVTLSCDRHLVRKFCSQISHLLVHAAQLQRWDYRFVRSLWNRWKYSNFYSSVETSTRCEFMS